MNDMIAQSRVRGRQWVRLGAVLVVTLVLMACARVDNVLHPLIRDVLGVEIPYDANVPVEGWPITSEEVGEGVSALKWGISRLEDAATALDKALKDDPCDASAHFYLAYMWERAMYKINRIYTQQWEAQKGIFGRGAGMAAPTWAFETGDPKMMRRYHDTQLNALLTTPNNEYRRHLQRALDLRAGRVSECRK